MASNLTIDILKLTCSSTLVLFVTLVAGHKISKTHFVTDQTMFKKCLQSHSSHRTTKYSSVSDITQASRRYLPHSKETL